MDNFRQVFVEVSVFANIRFVTELCYFPSE